jgi:type III secretion protein D
MHIASGLHGGVECVLADGQYTFGSGTAVDFVLLDDGVRPLHFKLHLDNGRATVEALAEPCAVDGIGSLEAGESCVRRLPVGIAVGACRIELGGAARKGSRRRHWQPELLARLAQRYPVLSLDALAQRYDVLSQRYPALSPEAFAQRFADLVQRYDALAQRYPALSRAALARTLEPSALVGLARRHPARTMAGAGIAVAGLFSITAMMSASNGSETAPTDPAVTTASATGAFGGKRPLAAPRARGAAGSRAARDAAQDLRLDLENAGLLNIKLEAAVGVVAASGSVAPSAAPQWLALQQQFDERFLGEITLINGVVVKEESVPGALAIEAVWRGPEPHIVVRGQKYPEGAVIESGWAIKRIEADRVVLERQGRLVAIRY